MFQGATALNLDAKGRLAVPTRHRDSLQSGAAGKQVLTAHPHRCILLYPAPAWEPIRAQVMAFPSLDPQFARWKRLLGNIAVRVLNLRCALQSWKRDPFYLPVFVFLPA